MDRGNRVGQGDEGALLALDSKVQLGEVTVTKPHSGMAATAVSREAAGAVAASDDGAGASGAPEAGAEAGAEPWPRAGPAASARSRAAAASSRAPGAKVRGSRGMVSLAVVAEARVLRLPL